MTVFAPYLFDKLITQSQCTFVAAVMTVAAATNVAVATVAAAAALPRVGIVGVTNKVIRCLLFAWYPCLVACVVLTHNYARWRVPMLFWPH
jgi:hypothetical protein